MKKIHVGDVVIVTAGKSKGTKSTVEAISWNKVFVKWVNLVKKAVKWQGHVEKVAPIDISNIQLFDEKSKWPSRVWIKEVKGKKVRFYKKSWEVIK